jgi:hypothetical protein
LEGIMFKNKGYRNRCVVCGKYFNAQSKYSFNCGCARRMRRISYVLFALVCAVTFLLAMDNYKQVNKRLNDLNGRVKRVEHILPPDYMILGYEIKNHCKKCHRNKSLTNVNKYSKVHINENKYNKN